MYNIFIFYLFEEYVFWIFYFFILILSLFSFCKYSNIIGDTRFCRNYECLIKQQHSLHNLICNNIYYCYVIRTPILVVHMVNVSGVSDSENNITPAVWELD